MASRVQLAHLPVLLAAVNMWQCGWSLRGKDQPRLCSALCVVTRMMFMWQIVILSEPGGTGLAKPQLEFVRACSKKAEILMYKLRVAETGMKRK